MTLYRVWHESSGVWWLGFPHAMPVIPEDGQSESEALSRALGALNATRSDLFFETNEVRQRFEAVFGSNPR